VVESDWLTVAEAVRVRDKSEGALLEQGISGGLSFYVYVPGLELCRVPVVALQHFKAGADEYTASGMPQRYGYKLSGPWLVKRALLRLERSTDHDIERLLNPPAADGQSNGKVKIWTPERTAEARAYRDKHGLKKTAEHYGVSQATISRHLPTAKPKPAPFPFPKR
jgi:hypothetical protein